MSEPFESDPGQIDAAQADPASIGEPDAEAPSLAGRPDAGWGRAWAVTAAVVSFVLFWWVGSWLDFPRHRQFGASILQQPGLAKLGCLLAVAALLISCTILGQLAAGRSWPFAGVFASACGLSAWSLRGGPSRFVYFHAAEHGDARSVFLLLALETALLSIMVGVVWNAFTLRRPALDAHGRASRPQPAKRLQAMAAMIVLTAGLVMLLTPVDAKKQAITSVLLSTFIAASITEHFFGEGEIGAWYWAGPAVVGVVGYLLAYCVNSAGAPDVTGHLMGWIAPLARPLPLDYASAATVGALLGFWSGDEHPQYANELLMSPRDLAGAYRRSRRPAPSSPAPAQA